MKKSAHSEIDDLLAKVEKRMAFLYEEGQTELVKILESKKKEALASKGTREEIVDLLNKINRQAIEEGNAQLPKAYELSFNDIPKSVKIAYEKADITYKIINKETLESLQKRGTVILPKMKPKPSKTGAWNMQILKREIKKSIELGEDIKTISKRLSKIFKSNLAVATRNVRTAITSSENLGRYNRFISDSEALKGLGFRLVKRWGAAHDERTRPHHRILDGTSPNKQGYFQFGLRYPGDPEADPSEVYNCRCTLIEDIEIIKE